MKRDRVPYCDDRIKEFGVETLVGNNKIEEVTSSVFVPNSIDTGFGIVVRRLKKHRGHDLRSCTTE